MTLSERIQTTFFPQSGGEKDMIKRLGGIMGCKDETNLSIEQVVDLRGGQRTDIFEQVTITIPSYY